MSRLRPFALLLLVVVVASSAALGIVASLRGDPDVLASDTANDVVTIEPRRLASDGAVQATVTLRVASWRTGTVGRNGVVTSIATGVDDVLEGGEVLFTLDDAPIVAFVGSAPLVRELGTGAQGEDVKRLQEFLLEHADMDVTDLEINGRLGSTTARAVREFRQERGMSDSTSIGPGDLVWIGDSQFIVRSTEFTVGARLSTDDPVLIGPPLTIERVIDARDLDDDSEWLLEIGEISVPIKANLSLSDQHARQLLDTVGEMEAVPAVIRFAQPITVTEIPATAVWTSSGVACVFAGDSHDPVEVDVLDVAFGQARVEARESDRFPDRVVVNPEVLDEHDCRP